MSSIVRCVVALSVMLLVACSGGGGGTSVPDVLNTDTKSPVIGTVFTDIFHYHPSTYQKFGIGDAERIEYTFSVWLADPQGRETIAEAYIYNETSDAYYQLIGGVDEVTLDTHYDAVTSTYQIRGSSETSPDSVNLRGWHVYVRDNDGNETIREFSLRLPGGDNPVSESVAYSNALSTPPADSIPALETMTVTDNALSFSVDVANEFFRISFETTDTRADTYVVLFYDNAALPNYLGRASTLTSAAMNDTAPLMANTTVDLVLPWSELDDAIDPSAINGIHIVLLDEGIDYNYASGNDWHSYLGYSEFLTL